MNGIVLWRWMLKSFLFFSKVDSSQYRNTFVDSWYGIRDTEYYGGITGSWKIGQKPVFWSENE